MAFRSCWRRAMKAPHNAEVNPIETRSADHAGTPEKMGETSISRYTPALTIVGACRKALTGVIATIAPGTQKISGTRAALVNADHVSRAPHWKLPLEGKTWAGR